MGEVFLEMIEGGFSVDGKMGEKVDEEVEDSIGAEERFGNGEASIGGVVESSLEPLRCGGVEGILREGEDETGDAANAFGIDRVALVGHSRGANLVFRE